MSINAGVCPQCRGSGFVVKSFPECNFTWAEGAEDVRLWYKDCPTCNADGHQTWIVTRAPTLGEMGMGGGGGYTSVEQAGKEHQSEGAPEEVPGGAPEGGVLQTEPREGHQKGED